MYGIIIDTREHHVLQVFEDRADYCRAQLSHGDFIIGEWTAEPAPKDTPGKHVAVDTLMCIDKALIAPTAVIERKTLADYASSIIDGRIANLYMFAKSAPCRVILLVEGMPEHDTQYGPNITGKNINSSILCAQQEYGIHVMFSASIEDTCRHLVTLHTVLKPSNVNHKVMAAVGGCKDDAHGKKAHAFWKKFPGIGDVTVVAIMERVSIAEALDASIVPSFATKGAANLYASAVEQIRGLDKQANLLSRLAPASARANSERILEKAGGLVSTLATCAPKDTPIGRTALKNLQAVMNYKIT